MSEKLDTNTETLIETVSVEDIDNLLGMPGSESVMVPTEEKKPSFFSSTDVDVSFLNNNESSEAETKESDTKELDTTTTVDEIIEEADVTIEDVKSGRPSLDKEGMAQLANELSKEGLITPFEGEEDFKNYTLNDYKELFNANISQQSKKSDYNAQKSFFESLPNELQYAARYIQDGGEDLKGLFSVLSQNEETKSLSTDSERGQQSIIRTYLQNTNYGNTEDIDEQIEEWNDLGKLEDKALKFKPKLDKMQEQLVQRQVKEQEVKRKQQEDQAQHYMESIYNTLDSSELNGIKLNSKTQNLLYSGLVQPNYPSISGKQTNLFGHLIEKYQYVEPRHDLIAEALWLLADPEGYRSEISKNAKSAHVEETVRKLKTEQSSKNTSSVQELEPISNKKRKQGIKRPTENFFKR